ncbi:deleted in oral cancer 1/cdk2-associated protein 1 [Holotrichia oblita]|uniref:Deleted in oral cancer 1/cdk2-associated protein 1 n=1 Tax=Holotrichia oblita TaxID=644536 RepID=A0ACB9SP28_HOLOL|nr:deleted in oral cancer 1/cdk2-associated protein 1 [Holotrichia oblita]
METVDIQAVESKLSDVTVTAIPIKQSPQQPSQSKYAQLLGVIEEMGKEVRPTYAGSRSSAERLKRGIVHARFVTSESIFPVKGSRRRAGFCAGTYPKLMVTPVHRFQVLGGSEGFGRRVRTPSYRNHPRFFIHRPSSCQQDNANNHTSTNPNVVSSVEQVNIARSVTLLPTRDNVSVTPRTINTPTTGLKCGVWAFFAMVTFFIAGAKFYFHGNESSEEPSSQVPNSISPLNATEVSPPPYHVAIMLPQHADVDDSLTILRRDSPPPSYEKAVT